MKPVTKLSFDLMSEVEESFVFESGVPRINVGGPATKGNVVFRTRSRDNAGSAWIAGIAHYGKGVGYGDSYSHDGEIEFNEYATEHHFCLNNFPTRFADPLRAFRTLITDVFRHDPQHFDVFVDLYLEDCRRVDQGEIIAYVDPRKPRHSLYRHVFWSGLYFAPHDDPDGEPPCPGPPTATDYLSATHYATPVVVEREEVQRRFNLEP
jgi:hypothetical protein